MQTYISSPTKQYQNDVNIGPASMALQCCCF